VPRSAEPTKRRKTITLLPGDPLPEGVYINGWKLDVRAVNKPRALYLIIEETKEPD